MGCGSSTDPRHAKDTAFVTGKVTLANELLPSGTVVFIAANGWTARGRIRPDGSYVMAGVPIGEVKIGIERGGGAPGVKRGAQVRVPSRYRNPQTSGLTYTVAAGGEQEKNIELTP
jgi:hypothetical protein